MGIHEYTWPYNVVSCKRTMWLCWMFIPLKNVSLVLTGSFCMLRNATKVFDLLITESILQLFSLAPRLIMTLLTLNHVVNITDALTLCAFVSVHAGALTGAGLYSQVPHVRCGWVVT